MAFNQKSQIFYNVGKEIKAKGRRKLISHSEMYCLSSGRFSRGVNCR